MAKQGRAKENIGAQKKANQGGNRTERGRKMARDKASGGKNKTGATVFRQQPLVLAWWAWQDLNLRPTDS